MRFRLLTLALIFAIFVPHDVRAQKSSLKLDDVFGVKKNEVDESAKVTASLEQASPNEVQLAITVVVPDDFFVYSTNPDYAGATVIDIAQAKGVSPLGKPVADRAPKVKYESLIKQNVEKFYKRVTWTQRYKIDPGTDPNSILISGSLTGTYCTDGIGGQGKCIPIRPPREFQVALAGAVPAPTEPAEPSSFPFTADVSPERNGRPDPLTLKFELTPADAGPGDEVQLNVTMTLDPHWHAYAQTQSEEGGLPTELNVTPFGLEDVSGEFVPDVEPVFHHDDLLDVDLIYFEERVTWTRTLKVAPDTPAGHYGVRGDITYQVCKQSCLPPRTEEFALGETGPAPPVSKRPAPKATNSTPIESPELLAEMAALYPGESPIKFETLGEQIKTTLWTALFGAFVGGILLNLMPCVFPVLGIKVMGFVQQAGSDPKKIRNHGLVFTAGLLVSMWCLAGAILSLKLSTGQSVNWGQQMGNPVFVGSMIVLLFVLGLNMAGIFEMGTSVASVGGSLQNKKGYSNSFFSGILTTLIATPCSGPFLGAAMGYTLNQDWHVALFLFTVFGLGIAVPYLFLAFFPALINKLPRPGAWMETFKVTMAFALFATSAFFMKTFGGQTGTSGLSWLAMALVVIGLAAYFYGHWGLPHLPPKTRLWKGYVLPAAIAAVGLFMAYDASQQEAPELAAHGDWENWVPGKVEYLVGKKKRIVWVDYTADW